MHRLQSFAVCFLAVIGATMSASFFKRCKPNDAACQLDSATDALPKVLKGGPELCNLPAVDPMILDNVRNDDKNFELSFTNMTVTGINKCKILNFSRNPDESTMTMVTECPISTSGQYSLNGQVLFLTAKGNGAFHIETEKTQMTTTVHVKEVKKAGAKHWKFTKFDYDYDILGKVKIDFENLFDGDEASAKPLREALQNNAKEMIKDLGGSIITQMLTKVVNHAQSVINCIPISELEL